MAVLTAKHIFKFAANTFLFFIVTVTVISVSSYFDYAPRQVRVLSLSSASHTVTALAPSTEVLEAASSNDEYWDDSADASVRYNIRRINLLPFTDGAVDSTAVLDYMSGTFSDGSHMTYPKCTFTHVCLTAQTTAFSVQSNLTVHMFYALLFPQCHVSVYNIFPLCKCFHYLYRPALMPYPYQTSADERAEARRHAERMAAELVTATVDWSKAEFEEYRPAAYDMIPTEHSTSKNNEAMFLDPFNAPLSRVPQPPALSPPTVYNHYGHFWSINKWVQSHHIAHWSQKLIAWQAVYGHWTHACQRRYVRQRVSVTEWRFIEAQDDIDDAASGASDDGDKMSDDDGSGRYITLDCHPPIEGIVYHDSNRPLYDHEANIMNITVHAVQRWIDAASKPKFAATVEHNDDDDNNNANDGWINTILSTINGDKTNGRIYQRYTHVSLNASKVAQRTLFNEDLYQQYTADYLLKNPSLYHHDTLYNITSLSCFNRITMTPLYGLFVDNAYDSIHFRRAANEHYGFHYEILPTYRHVTLTDSIINDDDDTNVVVVVFCFTTILSTAICTPSFNCL